MTGLERFKLWFADPLRELAGGDHKGFIVLMVGLPLLERYLRGRTNAEPNSDRFRMALCDVFPELPLERSEAFWITYRHGLLHNVAFWRDDHGLTDNLDGPLQVDAQQVLLNQRHFVERILLTIERDFAPFEAAKPAFPVTPWEYRAGDWGDSQRSLYDGTGAPRRC